MEKTTEESVLQAMDGEDINLYPYLPYIMQDLWELGTSPEVVIKLIRQHKHDYANLRILDLGCGKGAVSIRIAQEFKCCCHGIDAIQEFIRDAQIKAEEYHVEKYCRFECADIRNAVPELIDYDIIILGSIGPVFGDYYAMLSILAKCIKESGLLIIDDGYIDDASNYSHPLVEKRSKILKDISDAGMKLIDEVIISPDEMAKSDEYIYEKVKNRCLELAEQYPERRKLFLDYIKKQEVENDVIETKITCSTMLIGKV